MGDRNCTVKECKCYYEGRCLSGDGNLIRFTPFSRKPSRCLYNNISNADSTDMDSTVQRESVLIISSDLNGEII